MQNKKQAFTLVELIVVITILAILGTIAFISLQGYSASSRDSVRISDVGSMKTTLELFHLNAGKYPLPDNNEIVSFSGDTLWYQGTFGETVIKNVSRNMSEIPNDPLTNKEYIYSVSNTKNEFQILNLLESDIALNTISQTNAANIKVIPRIDGTYNGVFIKTPKYIVPTPSIITSEEIGLGAGLVLNSTNIKSQVTHLGKNIPKVGNVNTATGELNIKLSVFTGSITKTSTDVEKIAAIEAIQNAYSGSDLANQSIFSHILTQTTPQEILNLSNETLLNIPAQNVDIICDEGYVEISGECVLDQCAGNIPTHATTTALSQSAGSNWSYNTTPGLCTFECGQYTVWNSGNNTCDLDIRSVVSCTAEGQRFLDSTKYGSCDFNNIIVCNSAGAGYIVSACNVGTYTSGLGEESYGNFFQWGNNGGLLYGDTTKQTTALNASSYPASTYSNPTFVYGANLYGSEDTDWTSPQNNNLWGDVTNTSTDRRGPCLSGYHVPSIDEWVSIKTAGGWLFAEGDKLSSDLKMPKAGYRYSLTATYVGNGTYGYYWSSSSRYFNSTYGYMSNYLSFTSTTIQGSVSLASKRAMGYSVRCIKN